MALDDYGDVLTITKRIEFDAGHRVPTHGGKCRSPHGHRYAVEVRLSGSIIEDDDGGVESGMLTDFGFVKDLLVVHVHDVLDHGFIVWERDEAMLRALATLYEYDEVPHLVTFPLIPTAENIARWIAFKLDNLVAQRAAGLTLQEVTVWETPTSTARWSRFP